MNLMNINDITFMNIQMSMFADYINRNINCDSGDACGNLFNSI